MASRIRTTINGKLISMTAADWAGIRMRYKPGAFRWLQGPCPLCEKFADRGCKGCTLHKFKKNEGNQRLGCMVVLSEILETKDLTSLALWGPKDRPRATKLVKKLNKFMDKVEARQ